jgi:hypothetical protein
MIVPEETPAAIALREELCAKRGGVHLEVGRFVPVDPPLGANAAAGFQAPPDWTAVADGAAVAFVVRALTSRPSGKEQAPAIPPAEAEALALRVRALFSAHARFFTTGEAGETASAATEDSSLFVIDGDYAGLFWVEREE